MRPTVHPKCSREAAESKGQPSAHPLLAALLLLTATACLEAMDQRSNVHDLRVLGISVESPELMAPFCAFDFSNAQSPAVQAALSVYATPIDYTALIADPAGDGREISYALWACPSPSDVTCSREGEPRFLIKQGTTTSGELKIEGIRPGLLGVDLAKLARGDASGALLFEVLRRDQYRGLGGIRVPLRLHLKAGDEEVWALKLMVYSCNFFPHRPDAEPGPTMKQNITPVLPGVNLDGTEWHEDEVRALSGPGPFKVEPLEYKHLEEHYVVPSFQLQPIELDERWEVAWHGDLGRFSPQQSGGSDPGAGEARNRSEWTPGSAATEERDVMFWFVVRDGRGGQSWLTRRAHYTP